MEDDLYGELEMPSGHLTGIEFDILNAEDVEKISTAVIEAVSEVTDSKLGLPNASHQCSTCGAKQLEKCEGHFGIINFPCAILHPYFLSEVAQILNKICPGCKSIRNKLWKDDDSATTKQRPRGCKYCAAFSNEWYPIMKFRVSSKDLFGRTTITVEVDEKFPTNGRKKSLRGVLPDDYWDFIPKDDQQQENSALSNRRVLSHAQVHSILKDVDPKFIRKFVSKTDSLFLECFPVTPNCHRVTEAVHALSNGQRVAFDERTRAYRKLVGFRGVANELGSRVLDCLKMSKLKPDQSLNNDPTVEVSGSKWFKEVVLGKRNDHSFRMVVVGDPRIKLGEIGIPCNIAERLHITDHLNPWNWEKLNDYCNFRLLEKEKVHVRRKGKLVSVSFMDEFHIGDTLSRPLQDGDIVLINRPPSIHQHSLIALSVKVLPIKSVVSINPVICQPLHGDFDGDCLHGYVPQSVDSRVELSELVGLNHQLINGQSGRNLLSFSQDSLTATHLVLEDGILLNQFQMQQLAMFCPHQLQLPAIVKASSSNSQFWSGKQLFSMIMPQDFDYAFPPNNVYIKDGELLTSSDGSVWLRDAVGSFFYDILRHCQDKTVDFLHVSQEVLGEWLSMRGFSVSLSDLYVSSDYWCRKKLLNEVSCGLQEAQRTCHVKQLMADSCLDFLIGDFEENQVAMLLDVERLCYERQRSAAVNQASVCAFKQFFRDIQGLVYQYACKDNALVAMLKAGSKGNLLKLVQHSMCLGLQHSLVPLSFRLPHRLSCATWNSERLSCGVQKNHETTEYVQSFIPYAVIESSFLTGLNPLECFVHSLTSRDSSFSDNAALPGTLNRRLMFFMRNIVTAYDGTVRQAYGNQVIQFCYDSAIDKVARSCASNIKPCTGHEYVACQPVGSLSACAISEAAYSALDQPISTLELSPLLNLKNVLECGLRKFPADQTASLHLSEKLEKRKHGFEIGAFEVKSHLERVLFSEIVSTANIVFSPHTRGTARHTSPWVCHFHVCKDIAKRKKIKVHSIIDALREKCDSIRVETKGSSPILQITSKDCSYCLAESLKENSEFFCIMVTVTEGPKSSNFNILRDVMIPGLLETVVKGFAEIRKVDILWDDRPEVPKSHRFSGGELYLRVHMSELCGKMKFWSSLLNNCLEIDDMIDWERSHPDGIHGVFLAYGIDAAWELFVSKLKSAIADTGKAVLPEHLLLVANCLSATGEFVGLNAKGMARQIQETSVSSSFVQACFSNPSATFIKAAKVGASDNLQGSLDALAWGKMPSTGTGAQFDIVYSGKGYEIDEPVDIYSMLGREISCRGQNLKTKAHHAVEGGLDNYRDHFVHDHGGSVLKRFKVLEKISRSFLRTLFSVDDIQRLSHRLKFILHKYPVNHNISESDKALLMMALFFHPRREEKLGIGAKEIRVGYHSEHEKSRCFLLVRSDDTVEDFSYHKCVYAALEMISPWRAKRYQSKWLKSGSL